jgi:hypothetical protein
MSSKPHRVSPTHNPLTENEKPPGRGGFSVGSI